MQDAKFEVSNVQSYSNYVLHIGQLEYGQLSVGAEVNAAYDKVSLPLGLFVPSSNVFRIFLGTTSTT